ncbi:hypothetical protein WOLCODRAFT_156219 [Wolfiporia cocos MD-104 SS10]|uniref:Uncharacterized protein n=1 Tax=Wolfiporia cocos (strain MD-104) TaxID=742152 RepID=A0A2H3J6Y0_WOLCO|nr:hypothetical protein WOLCODRAFT_156219 [Wolfiporia cocos MD-104 SS10]
MRLVWSADWIKMDLRRVWELWIDQKSWAVMLLRNLSNDVQAKYRAPQAPGLVNGRRPEVGPTYVTVPYLRRDVPYGPLSIASDGARIRTVPETILREGLTHRAKTAPQASSAPTFESSRPPIMPCTRLIATDTCTVGKTLQLRSREA